jgi:hypothetical protein
MVEVPAAVGIIIVTLSQTLNGIPVGPDRESSFFGFRADFPPTPLFFIVIYKI